MNDFRTILLTEKYVKDIGGLQIGSTHTRLDISVALAWRHEHKCETFNSAFFLGEEDFPLKWFYFEIAFLYWMLCTVIIDMVYSP